MPRAVIAFALCLVAGRAAAGPTYAVHLDGVNVSQATPVRWSDAHPVNASNGTASFTGAAFSYPGHVGVFDRVDMTWSSGLSGGSVAEVRATQHADDFVISGPPGPVNATFHFRVSATFARLGGFPGNGSHGSRLDVQAIANNIWATGVYQINNAGTTTADGIFAGHSGDQVDIPFSVTGSFPVGTPFAVDLRLYALCANYGNVFNTNPGFVETNGGGTGPGGGLRLEQANGVVMDLPAGYTLNAPSMGVVDNHFASLVGVSSPPANDPLTVAPNPTTAGARLTFALARAGRVRAAIFDLAGRSVRTLADGPLPAGGQALRWDGQGDDGRAVPAGVYFVRVATPEGSLLRRIVRVE
jgi:hypothetical protein